MLRALFSSLNSSSSSSTRSQIRCAASMMAHRQIASSVRGAAQQARLCPALPAAAAAAAAHRLQASRLWQVEPLRRELHSTVARAAAEVSNEAGQQEEPPSPIYEAAYDAAYVCFSCITGTVGSVDYLPGADGSPWLRFTLRVPTPHSNTFTSWHCLASGELASMGKEYVAEGAFIQVSGIHLVKESLQKSKWEKLLQQPAIYAESLGYFVDPPASEADHLMLPPMKDADLDAFINSGGQQLYAPGPAAPTQPAAAPISVPGMPSQPANDVEAAWMSLFLENHLWNDQRDTKTGKQPDFRMQSKATDGRRDALWLTDRQLPSWVRRNLQLLPGNKPYPLPPFIPREALDGSPKEQQWVEVFTNYTAFWDNRINKLSPRGPDFAPKDKENGGTAVWIEDKQTPDWAKENLDKLPPPPAARR